MTLSRFSTGVLDEVSHFAMTTLEPAHTPVGEDGVVRGIKVFRTGTFPDSRGRVNTWTVADLKAMEAHFALLSSNGILPNVPVKEDHSESMRDVVGWYRKVYVGDIDASGVTYLLADIEFTRADAKEKWNNKTYRNRSIEIAAYPANDGTVYRPTVIGLAFVDIPAVEGLFRSPLATTGQPNGDSSPSGQATSNQGAPVTNTNTDAFRFRVQGAEVSDFAAVQAHISTLEAELARLQAGAAYTFRLKTGESSDFAAVQTYIAGLESANDALETFRQETNKTVKVGFVEQLAKENKITAKQKELFSALVLTMDAEQFGKFREGFEGAPAASLFGQHATGTEGGSASSQNGSTADRVEVLRNIVQNHRWNGHGDEFITTTPSYKELMKLTDGKG